MKISEIIDHPIDEVAGASAIAMTQALRNRENLHAKMAKQKADSDKELEAQQKKAERVRREKDQVKRAEMKVQQQRSDLARVSSS